MISPLKLSPAFKDYLWGGTRLRDDFNKSCSLERIAESWELSCHSDGLSYISGTGKTLRDYIMTEGRAVLGTNCRRFSDFPVIVKLIDANESLSVQVHPDDEYAMETEGESGKTEMWYVIDCEPDSFLLYGLNRELTKEQFSGSIKDNTFMDYVKKVPVKKGDVFFIRPGTVHAIGKGILLAEIQQNSNTTYRIYDYGRTDKDGNLRELHTEKACDVSILSPSEPYPANSPVKHSGYTETLLSACSYFTVHRLVISSAARLCADSSSFEHILVTEGTGILEGKNFSMDFSRGDSIFIPAGYGSYSLSGNCLIIKTRID